MTVEEEAALVLRELTQIMENKQESDGGNVSFKCPRCGEPFPLDLDALADLIAKKILETPIRSVAPWTQSVPARPRRVGLINSTLVAGKLEEGRE